MYIYYWMMWCTFDHPYLLSTAQSTPSCRSCYRSTLLKNTYLSI
uniref:Uncharacterized protein n=1 Tax=Siphoviridae sp. ct4Ap70 TaxID=2825328 RepID=A0A8S5NXH0_9CAUD|nr:MAG TPA: hypothetical protein [Siphoviridae sp. ct4Ap70]